MVLSARAIKGDLMFLVYLVLFIFALVVASFFIAMGDGAETFLAWFEGGLMEFPIQESQTYGVDCSFPIVSTNLSCKGLSPLNRYDRQMVYETYMKGCREFYGDQGDLCDKKELDRLEMNRRQPQSIVNFTSTGFWKLQAPQRVMNLLSWHFQQAWLNEEEMLMEKRPTGNVCLNHWEAPTYMVTSVMTNDTLQDEIWDATKALMEEWTGMEVRPASMYGIRVYTRGSILSHHVDRLPLVTSAIINVAQDVDEAWPLEVIDRRGEAVNITLQAGEMILYESASLIHARPFALNGRYYANMFVHFEPIWQKHSLDNPLSTYDPSLPPYLLPNSPAVEQWKQRNPRGWNKPLASLQSEIQNLQDL